VENTSVPLWALILAVATLGISAIAKNRTVRRRNRFTLVALGALVALHFGAQWLAGNSLTTEQAANVANVERLFLALALVNLVITLLFNPLSHDRVTDRAPAIVQDALVIALFGATAVFVLKNTTFLAASAIVAAAVGFALQDTLANAFAGLAIQVEKPFRVGHWISLASYEGKVAEVTWRATKIRTKAGNLVILPNNTVAKEAITNYSEPTAPARFFVDVGATYAAPPNLVRDALLSAMRQVSRVLASPPSDVLLQDFGASAVTYRARFWIDDFADLEYVSDEVRRAIFYEFRRRDIEIPWPIQVQYERHEHAVDPAERSARFQRAIAQTSLLGGLDRSTQEALAAAANDRMYADGEAIVREGQPGDSMFLVEQGRVAIIVGSDRREVAVTEAGGYFGEMSLLTGEPRSATVIARGDCTVIEIRADAFRSYVTRHPEIVDRLAEAAAGRRRELEAVSRAAATTTATQPVTLARRIREFFRIHG
jgi:small-conductance mechanosensitive channel/CRP-like cAMP-binding protein